MIAPDQSDIARPTLDETPMLRSVRHEIRIRAPAATVFALLTDAQQMTTWLARNVKADPRPDGIFRLIDFSGFSVEDIYLEVIPQ